MRSIKFTPDYGQAIYERLALVTHRVLLVALVVRAILGPALRYLFAMLVHVQPPLQLLLAALLLRSRVPLALLLAQRLKLRFQRGVAWPGRIVWVTHSGDLLLPVALVSFELKRLSFGLAGHP
jgi:predicted permease